jgi:hypothetical protein
MAKAKARPIHRCRCETCQCHPYSQVAQEHQALNRLLAACDEKTRRRIVGLLAQQWGAHCISLLRRITGLSRNTIQRGKHEIEHPLSEPPGRIRKPGAGRLRVEKKAWHLRFDSETPGGCHRRRSDYGFEVDA